MRSSGIGLQGFTITAAIRAEKVAYDGPTDGCFPAITNDTVLIPAEALAAYHYQPTLERRPILAGSEACQATG